MGGMIAQTMAIERPERVRSLTSIMSTTGERRAGLPKLRVWGVLMRRAPQEKQAYIERFVRVFRLIGSKGYPLDDERIRELAAASYERGHHTAGTGRQLAAIMASGDRTEQLRSLRCRRRSSTAATTRSSPSAAVAPPLGRSPTRA